MRLASMQDQDGIAWCYFCGKLTMHQVSYHSDPRFTGKILVCRVCGETVKLRLGGQLRLSEMWKCKLLE
jgi:transcription elongation factor Elf1